MKKRSSSLIKSRLCVYVCVCVRVWERVRNTHRRSLVGTAHREVPSPHRASCCSSTWPWWCSKLWGRNIFLPRIWWNKSSSWYLPWKEKVRGSLYLHYYISPHPMMILWGRDQYVRLAHSHTNCRWWRPMCHFSYRSSAACFLRGRSPAGTCTGSCQGCWCRCQTGICSAPPHTRWYLDEGKKISALLMRVC